MLFESLGVPIEGLPADAATAFCALRRGDSGRGNEGLDFGFKSGLRARPGPTDWLNLGFDEDVGV